MVGVSSITTDGQSRDCTEPRSGGGGGGGSCYNCGEEGHMVSRACAMLTYKSRDCPEPRTGGGGGGGSCYNCGEEGHMVSMG